MSRVLFLLLAMVLAGLGQPTLAAPLPDELPAALPAAPPVAPLPMGSAPQPQPEAAEPDLPGSDAASADGEATTKDGLKIGNGSLRLRQDDPGPTRGKPAARSPPESLRTASALTDGPRPVVGRV
ncbi:hypothetical protein ACG3RN_10115 [Pseudomonas aeruginosa]